MQVMQFEQGGIYDSVAHAYYHGVVQKFNWLLLQIL